MLGKLMKYEIKASARAFLPIYGAVIVMAVLARLTFFRSFLDTDNYEHYDRGFGAGAVFVTVLYGIIWFLFFAFIVAMFVLTFIVIIQRFYKNLMGDEGYLMFTLPVTPWTLTSSKLLTGGMWLILSSIVTMFGLSILAIGSDFWREAMVELYEAWSYLALMLDMPVALLVLEVILISLAYVAASIIPIYFAITLGGYMWPRHRILGAFGAYIAIMIFQQIVTSIFAAGFISNIERMDAFFNSASESAIAGWMNTMTLSAILINVLLCTGYFVCTNLLLSKKLNLE